MITDPTAVFAILAAVVVVSLWLERRWHLFRSFGAAFIGILIGMVLSNTGVIPGTSPAYTFLVGPAVSAGIVLILLSVDVRTIAKAGPKMLLAFAIGAVGATAGALIAAMVLAPQIGPETWKLTGQYAATYTGGGANFAAVGAAFGTSGDLFAAGVAADVIITAVWMAICLSAPLVLSRGRAGPDTVTERQDVGEAGGKLYASVGNVQLMDIATLALIVLGTLWGSAALAQVFDGTPSVLWLTTIALVLAQIPRVSRVRGAGVIGNWIVLLFLVSNGAKSVVANIVAVGPPVVYFAVMTVGIHGLIIFGIGMLLRLDPRTLAVASQANIGGSASAMALASARGWTSELLPGVAAGILGNAVGNYIGLGIGVLARGWLGG